MIVRIAASGTSFTGAGKYYLHDKLDERGAERVANGEWIAHAEQSDERVWFTDTRNCLNSDPERALEEMWHTADDQAQLKRDAGIAPGGRRCEEPVKTLSLAWHKDDAPTPEHMVEAADAFLKHMGWDGHQAVLVGHRDTEHRHIHIILNRVNPETGRTLDDYKERKRAQEWALGYEKSQDNIRCEERELRAAQREHRASELDGAHSPTAGQTAEPTRTPANDHLPHNVVMISRPHERQFNADEQARAERDAKDREQLKADQRAEREAFFKDGAKFFKAARHKVYDEVRKEYKPEWRQLYNDAKLATAMVQEHSEAALERAFALTEAGRRDEAHAAFVERDDVRRVAAAQFAELKADLKARQTDDLRERQKDACDALRDIREAQYQELLQRQRDERAAFNAGQTLDNIRLGQETVGSNVRGEVLSPEAANQNVGIDGRRPGMEMALSVLAADKQGPPAIEVAPATTGPEIAARLVERPAPESDSVTMSTPEAPEPVRQVSDLAAGAIGSVASYLADQLGEGGRAVLARQDAVRRGRGVFVVHAPDGFKGHPWRKWKTGRRPGAKLVTAASFRT